MSLSDLSTQRTPQELLGDLVEYLDRAEASLAARNMEELVGLNDGVDMLCQQILALDVEVAKGFAPQLDGLMTRLVALEETMLAVRDETAAAIKALNTTKKANVAYQKNKPEV